VKRAQKIKQECERIWNSEIASAITKAKWRLFRGQLVLYVAGKYQSETNTDYEMV
jgi:hypothetical protein